VKVNSLSTRIKWGK